MGMAALDITIVDPAGNPVEPAEGAEVSVSLEMKELPGNVDESVLSSTMEIQHLNESSGTVKAETVAEAKDVAVEDGSAKAEFTVTSFSTFTLTWDNGAKQATIHWGTTENGEFEDFDTTKLVLLDTTEPTVSLNIAHEGYAFSDANVKYADGLNRRITPFLYKTNAGWEMDAYEYNDDIETYVLQRIAVPENGDIYVTYVEPASPNPHTPADSSKIPTPTTKKDVVVNTDGTATITLDITGKTVTETDKVGANVLIVLDNTSSMNFQMGNTRRWPAAKSAINTLVSILTTGENANNDIEFALLDFHCESDRGYPRRTRWNVNRLHSWNPTTGQHQNSGSNYWTSNATQFNSYIQNGSYDWDEDTDGTNWESPLTDALTILEARDEDPTYVLFVTDGEPNCAGTNYVYTYMYGDVVTPATYAARQIAAISGVSLYGIFVGNDDGYNTLNQVIYNAGGVTTINGTDSDALNDAFKNIAHTIIENLGAVNVSVDDGITELSSVSAQVPSGTTGGYEYYYKTENSDEWEKWADAPGATYTEENGVTWDLSSAGTLPAGTTYRVKFNVWPSQEALDLIANLNNGTVDYESLADDVKAQIKGNKTTGYTLATNTHLNTTYSFKGNTYTDPITPLPSGDMPLKTEQMKVAKVWKDSINPRNKADGVEFYLLVDGQYYWNDGTCNDSKPSDEKYYKLEATKDNDWSDSIYIAPGFVEAGQILERGHLYQLEEKAAYKIKDGVKDYSSYQAYSMDFASQTVRPMVIDGTLTYLVKIDDNYPAPSGSVVYTVDDASKTITTGGANPNYYAISGTGSGTVTGTNYKTPELDITKEIDTDNSLTDLTKEQLNNETFTYAVTLTAPADSDVSGIKYWIYSQTTEGGYTLYHSYDEDGNPDIPYPADYAPFDYSSTAKYIGNNNDSGVLIGDQFTTGSDGKLTAEIEIPITRQQVIRFTNLPVGTTYKIVESKANNASLSSEGYTVESIASTNGTKSKTAVDGDTVSGTIATANTRYYNKFTNVIKAVDINLDGTKKLSGYEWSGENYHFTINGSSPSTPMPGGVTGVTEIDLTAASGVADQTGTFGRIRFSSAGTYTYTVSETNGGTLQVVNGKAVQFGDAVTVTIEIEENNTTHDLSVKNVTGTGVTWDADSKTATATITNTAPTTTVSATKAWLNADKTTTAPANAKVTFTLYEDGVITNPAQTVELDGKVDGNGEATAWVATFSGLQQYKIVDGKPVEIKYTVFEQDSGKWTGYDRVETKPVANGGTITNQQQTTSLTIKKTVSGAMGDKSKPFKFTLSYLNTSGTLVSEKFDLTHNQTWTFESLPVGIEYTLTEDTLDSLLYVTTYSINDSPAKETKSEKFILEKTENGTSVVVNNDRDATVPTGIYTDLNLWRWLIGACFLMFFGSAIYGRRKRRQ